VTASQRIRWLFKPAVFVAALVPAVLLSERLTSGDLGADPLAEITSETGLWALRFLAATLAITPVRRLSGWDSLIRFRRMIGLFAFFYGLLHLAIFVVADRLASLGFPSPLSWLTIRDLSVSIAGEVYKRPYIAVGFASWLIMFALAITSTTGMIRRMGGRRWQALHRLVYVAVVAGVVHYWWSVKADVRDPRAYAIVVGVLLMFRLVSGTRKHAAQSPRSIARPAPNRVSTVPVARKPHAT
jgi:sulfoxide reductase heme-binding subunit YedZ